MTTPTSTAGIVRLLLLVVVWLALSCSVASCGDAVEIAEGSCVYEVELEPACFELSLFNGLSVELTDSNHLIRGFELLESGELRGEVVQAGTVGVRLLYRFRAPGVVVNDVYFEEIPSDFDDACTGEKNTLVVDCSALPLDE